MSCTSEILPHPPLAPFDQGASLVEFPTGSTAAVTLQLLQDLQKTLNPKALLTVFAERLEQMSIFGGLRFTSGTHDLVVEVGCTEGYAITFALQAAAVSLGPLVLYTDTPISPDERSLLDNLLKYLAFPMRNAVEYQCLRVRAMCDPLTGLGNRASFDADMSRELCRAERDAQALSLIILDVDRFKLINDTWGHQVGDSALKRLSRCARESIRDMDMVFRFAGDEFVVILPGAEKQDARRVADRMLHCVSRPAEDSPHDAMSISLGVAGWTPGMTADDLFAAADRALYQAKRRGRARVAVASDQELSRVAV